MLIRCWTSDEGREKVDIHSNPRPILMRTIPQMNQTPSCLNNAERKDEGATMNDGVLAPRSAELWMLASAGWEEPCRDNSETRLGGGPVDTNGFPRCTPTVHVPTWIGCREGSALIHHICLGPVACTHRHGCRGTSFAESRSSQSRQDSSEFGCDRPNAKLFLLGQEDPQSNSRHSAGPQIPKKTKTCPIPT